MPTSPRSMTPGRPTRNRRAMPAAVRSDGTLHQAHRRRRGPKVRCPAIMLRKKYTVRQGRLVVPEGFAVARRGLGGRARDLHCFCGAVAGDRRATRPRGAFRRQDEPRSPPARPAGALASTHRLQIDRSCALTLLLRAAARRPALGADQAEGQIAGGFLAVSLGVVLAEQIETIILPDTATSSRSIGEINLLTGPDGRSYKVHDLGDRARSTARDRPFPSVACDDPTTAPGGQAWT